MPQRAFLFIVLMFLPYGSFAFDAHDTLKQLREESANAQMERERSGFRQNPRYGEIRLLNDGTVIVKGKQWLRCSIGQAWNGRTCKGEPVKVTWDEAKDLVRIMLQSNGYAGHTDWRLPTILELESLRVCENGFHPWTINKLPGLSTPQGKTIHRKCNDLRPITQPTIESMVFPMTPMAAYWSGTSHLDGIRLSEFLPPEYSAYALHFGTGDISGHGLSRRNHFRLVREYR